MNTPTPSTAHALRMPGATLVTRLRVYDSRGPDGQRGGTPHMHFLCTEMYFVTRSRGAVEMITRDGFSRVELRTGSALLFSPGTIHRLINPHGDLEILVIMQNSGLPESGDNVVCLQEEWLTSDEKFSGAMHAATMEEAALRRDRGVEGFLELKSIFEHDAEEGRRALAKFYRLGTERTRLKRTHWQSVIEQGALEAARQSLSQLEGLNRGRTAYLMASMQHVMHPRAHGTPGFCGHLDRYVDPATLHMEGTLTNRPPR